MYFINYKMICYVDKLVIQSFLFNDAYSVAAQNSFVFFFSSFVLSFVSDDFLKLEIYSIDISARWLADVCVCAKAANKHIEYRVVWTTTTTSMPMKLRSMQLTILLVSALNFTIIN